MYRLTLEWHILCKLCVMPRCLSKFKIIRDGERMEYPAKYFEEKKKEKNA